MRLAGRNPVAERLRSNPSSIKQIYIEQGLRDASFFFDKAKKWGIPIHAVPRSKMLKIGRGINSQGIIVDVDEFVYLSLSDLIDTALEKKHSLLFLDGITDPQNLGAIIRSAACLGRFSIILPTHDSVEITPAVLRVASGGDNHVPVSHVANINKAIRQAKDAGFQIAGAVVRGGTSLERAVFNFPIGIVIGSEQKGIRDIIRPQLDLTVTIPMALDTLSFNVAQAASILCYEITRQKKIETK